VLHDSHQRKLIINRCWLIYDLITKKFRPLNEFHIEFPSRAELALISGYLQVLVEITRRGHFLRIHEEYDFIEHMLVVKVYSYNLLDKSKNSIIRADSLPHHLVDYKGHNLSHFPDHLHDEKGRICSFSGKIEDFVKRASEIIESEGQD
jgi:hypothetical protein